ncbi:MAG: class I SAM-dependent methyltransferase [Gammaproteobacteria bacterium]|nr:class I SAM-dependent methyltransferase [Gammaproteobacteria bacterium]
MSDTRSNESVLSENLSLDKLEIVDVGSGAGDLVRYMTSRGAHVTGLECGTLQLEKARSYMLAGDETYIEGVGQEMPFADASFDVVVFFNSLHHVPDEHMARALGEAGRVVKKTGQVYVAEPIASGSGFELHAPIDDETLVRAAAYDAILNATTQGLRQVREIFYQTVYHYPDFAAFKEDVIRIEPRRRDVFAALETDLQAVFDRLGVAQEFGMRFEQPMRVNLLEKV